MNKYSSYYSSKSTEYRPSVVHESHISHNVRKILRQDSEVSDVAVGLKWEFIEEYEDEITKAFDYLEDAFDYNFEAGYGDY
jgi:hypothetical protein